MARRAPRDHFGRLLVVLLALFVISGFRGTSAIRLVDAALTYLALGVAARATGLTGPRWAATAVGIGAVGAIVIVLAPFDNDATIGAVYLASALALFGTIVIVLARVLQHQDVDIQTIAGALCGYLLIGFLFTVLYGAANVLGSQPAFGGSVRSTDYSYFSFVTLTTLGYGDLAPVTDLARRLAIFEAVLGQVYLATMVARLVSMFHPRARPSREPLER
jgi:hypothetical protein